MQLSAMPAREGAGVPNKEQQYGYDLEGRYARNYNLLQQRPEH
jgi:hypothetical protein